MSFFKNPIIIIRHGQTQWNLEKRTQGHLDSPLTELGISQAKKTARKLKDYNFDLIVSSPLGRAIQTAKIVAEELRILEFQLNQNLAERNLGVLQGCTKDRLLKDFPRFFDSNNKFIQNSEIPNGEPLQDFLERIGKAVTELKSFARKRRLLVVTHDGALYAVISHVKKINFADVQKFYKFEHCKPIILE